MKDMDDGWGWYVENGVCAFCEHATHEFPDDDWHNKRHGLGWHTCRIHEGFRKNRPNCPDVDVRGAMRLTEIMNS